MDVGVNRYIDEQLHPERIELPPALSQRLSSMETLGYSQRDLAQRFREANEAAKNDTDSGKAGQRQFFQQMASQAADARLLRAVQSPRQLEEVMVDFWFNHFNVFQGKGLDRVLVANYEQEAIRPFVFGRFRDLLGATAHHPAMLFYLDNWLSVAPGYHAPRDNNPQGKANGLNENYARELMELHTLGVDGGYSQKDVTELARMLTGWTFEQRQIVKNGESFHFDDRRHDHGGKLWLGHAIHSDGQAEGEYALDVLAMHPATAHHLSYQLAQYFVQDVPPPALVERMARSYLDSKGDIRTVLRTLFTSTEFMAPASVGAKFKTPYQFVVSAARASAAPVVNIAPLLATMNQLGMPLYGCQTPDGYKNTQDAWLNPDALSRRIGFATALAAGRLPLATVPDQVAGVVMKQYKAPAAQVDPKGAAVVAPVLDAATLQATLGGAISVRTLATVASNPASLRAAMLLGSPDFMQH